MIARRDLLALAGGLATSVVLPHTGWANVIRTIPQRPSARVIVDNDFAGDPDGLIALAHQLLSPKTIVPLVTVSALDPKFAGAKKGRSAQLGRDDALEMFGVAKFDLSQPVVVSGAEQFAGGTNPAAVAIVDEAMRDDPLPLFVTCGGPLTNVAAALRLRPEISRRLTLLWIGGGANDEYNFTVDREAAQAVYAESDVPIWQIPAATYRALQFAVSEVSEQFRPISPLTGWLHDRYTNLPAWVQLGGALTMGDSPLVLLTAVSADAGRFEDVATRDALGADRLAGPYATKTVRRYDTLDGRLMWADCIAKFTRHGRETYR